MIKFLDLQAITLKYTEEIHAAVNRVIDSGRYLQDGKNKRFEKDYARYIGLNHCIGCANGLDAYYYDYIQNDMILLPDVVPAESNVYHIFSLFCVKRDALKKHLIQQGVQTLIHYPIPLHQQECYPDLSNMSFPITEKIHREELSLTISSMLEDDEVEKNVELINKFE